MNIPVYKAEVDAGIADMVRATASLAYVSQLEPFTPSKEMKDRFLGAIHDKKFAAQAALNDIDLYFSKSILVSSVWNLNDDVFDRAEIWIAKASPIHKPNNIGHDETKIVGHMVDIYPIDDDGNTIAADTAIDDLPDVFHLVDSSVIYRHWKDEAQQEVVEDLIAKAEAGEKFVSMECLFSGFDYAVRSPDGQNYVIARNKETAFLSKHLRAYNGDGTYDGHSVGRLLRGITFSGKGYVDKPGNPQSIIFAKADLKKFAQAKEINPFQTKAGVLISYDTNSTNKRETAMAENTNDTQVAELKASIKESQATIKDLTDKLANASVEKHVAAVAELSKKLDAAASELETAKAELATVKAAKAAADESVASLTTAKAALETELNTVKTEKAKANRISTLVDGQVAKEEASAIVEKFAALSDEQFAAMAELAIAAKGKKDSKTDDDEKVAKDKAADAVKAAKAAADAATAALNNATPDKDIALGTGGTAAAADEAAVKLESTRAGLRDWMSSRLAQAHS